MDAAARDETLCITERELDESENSIWINFGEFTSSIIEEPYRSAPTINGTVAAPIQNFQYVNTLSQKHPVQRKRAILNTQIAAEIFRIGAQAAVSTDSAAVCKPNLSRRSIFVSEYYGISPKAVRDIWNR